MLMAAALVAVTVGAVWYINNRKPVAVQAALPAPAPQPVVQQVQTGVSSIANDIGHVVSTVGGIFDSAKDLFGRLF